MKHILTILLFSSYLLAMAQEKSNEPNKYNIINNNSKYSLEDLSGKSLLELEYDTIVAVGINKVGLRIKDKWGIYSVKDNLLIPPDYDHVIGYKTLVPDQWPEIAGSGVAYYSRSNELRNLQDIYLVIKGTKIGAVRSDGIILVPVDYSFIKVEHYSIGWNDYHYFEVHDQAKKGIYTIDGKYLLEPEFSEISVTENLIIAKKSSSVHFCDKEGKKFDFSYSIDSYENVKPDGSVVVVKDMKKGVFKDGGLLVDIKYDDIGRFFTAGGFKTRNGNLYGVISPDGTLVIEPQYDDIDVTKLGFIVSKDGKKGVQEFDKKMSLQIEYDDILYVPKPFPFGTPSKNDLSAFIVTKEGKKGVVLPNKQMLLQIEYDSIEFVGTGFVVAKNGVQGYVLPDKTFLLPIQYEDIRVWESGHVIIVEQNQKEGMLGEDGKELLPIEYNSLALYPSGIILAELDNKFGLYKYDGQLLIEPSWGKYKFKSKNEVSFSNGEEWVDFKINELLKSKEK